jgi:hypothetical protein
MSIPLLKALESRVTFPFTEAKQCIEHMLRSQEKSTSLRGDQRVKPSVERDWFLDCLVFNRFYYVERFSQQKKN